MAVPGASAAPEYSLQAVAPRPLAATRHTTPLIGLPSGADLMRRTPLRAGGEVLLPACPQRRVPHEIRTTGETYQGRRVPGGGQGTGVNSL